MTSQLLGFNIWTKNQPKDYIGDFAEFAHDRNLPVAAIVDDVLPAVIFDRTIEQTTEMNAIYIENMTQVGFDEIHFVSDFLPDRNHDLTDIYAMSTRIGLSSFLGLLPEKKRQTSEDLTLTEMIDTCWQLCVLEHGMIMRGVDTYLTGRRSTALFRLAKSKIPHFEFETID